MSDYLNLSAIPFETMAATGKMEEAQRSLKSGKASHTGESPSQLKEACSEFESVFISYLLKEMRATIPKTGLISGGKAEEIYTSMLDSQIAKEIASQGGIGLSSFVLDQLESRPGDTDKKNIQKNASKD